MEIKQEFIVTGTKEHVWEILGDISNFAENMPGYQSHEIIDEQVSRWQIQMNIGPFTKRIDFIVTTVALIPHQSLQVELQAQNEPLRGHGGIEIEEMDAGTIKVEFALAITGSGPMAPMMEAMARPLMPRLAKEFADNLKRTLRES